MMTEEAFNAALSIMDGMGLTEAFGHLSMRIPEDPGIIRMTPAAGPGTGSCSNTICVNLEGERVSGDASLNLPLETPMHLAIYNARADVGAICRTHSPNAVTLGAAAKTVPCLHGFSLMLGRSIPVHHEIDLIHDVESAGKLADLLGNSRACLIRGNGALVVGQDIPQAVVGAVYLEEACRIVCGLGADAAREAAAAISEAECRARTRWHENEELRAWSYYCDKYFKKDS